MRHYLQRNDRLIAVVCIGTACVVGALGLLGCRTPRHGQVSPREDEQTLTTPEGRFEVREERDEKGALRRRIEGLVGEDGTFVPHGLQTNFGDDGHKLSELTYVDGVKQGLCTAWYGNGEVRSQGRYVNGREDGPWIVWSPEGRKLQEFNMDRGAFHGMYREWHQNGQLKYEVEYVKGLKQGTETYWDDQGNIAQQTHFVDGAAQP